jgi:beta-lactamase superfamily II metal-dependent hydrolase
MLAIVVAFTATDGELAPEFRKTVTEGVAPGSLSDELEVYFIDVGQGDATLVLHGELSMLIDTGDDSKGTMLQNTLQKLGITKLDLLILTHPDSDHIGGAPVIITKFDVDQVLMSDYVKDNKMYEKLLQALDYKNMGWTYPEPGSNYAFGDAVLNFVGPNETYDEPNNASLAFILSFGQNNFLFTGDTESTGENDILDAGWDIAADVYKVGHHGSNSSSGQDFMEAVDPAYAVISCSADNSYGHPHAEVLNRLREMGVSVFRTDEQGSIVATSDGDTITWNCAPDESWKAGER